MHVSCEHMDIVSCELLEQGYRVSFVHINVVLLKFTRNICYRVIYVSKKCSLVLISFSSDHEHIKEINK